MSRAPTALEPREQARFSSSQRFAILLRQSFEGADGVHVACCDECGAHIAKLKALGDAPVYLVGGGTHPGSGLPVIYEGARITTGLMAKDLGLSGEASRPIAEADLASTTRA